MCAHLDPQTRPCRAFLDSAAPRPASPRRQPCLLSIASPRHRARSHPTPSSLPLRVHDLAGPLAIHVSHRTEPFGPLVQTAIALLRRQYTDDQIASVITLPPEHAQGNGCIVGLVDVEATWPADLFNEVEQAQLTEQSLYPVGGTYITQLRNPRWLKYPVRTQGSNRLWQVQIPVDARCSDGTRGRRERLPRVHGRARQAAAVPVWVGAAPVRRGPRRDGAGAPWRRHGAPAPVGGQRPGERDKKLKKLQKALRQIEELKEKAWQDCRSRRRRVRSSARQS